MIILFHLFSYVAYLVEKPNEIDLLRQEHGKIANSIKVFDIVCAYNVDVFSKN